MSVIYLAKRVMLILNIFIILNYNDYKKDETSIANEKIILLN